MVVNGLSIGISPIQPIKKTTKPGGFLIAAEFGVKQNRTDAMIIRIDLMGTSHHMAQVLAPSLFTLHKQSVFWQGHCPA